MGKPYFMNLAVICVSEVNFVIDHGGVHQVRKTIIRCDLALNTSESREITQLFQYMQDIIHCYPMGFAEYAVQ